MWNPCRLRFIPLLVLVLVQPCRGALIQAHTTEPGEVPTEASSPQEADDRTDDSDWAVELAPGQIPTESTRRWELPELGTPAWSPSATDNAIRPDGSSLAEQAEVVDALPSSANIDTSMHTFYAIMAVLGLLAGGICCLQLAR